MEEKKLGKEELEKYSKMMEHALNYMNAYYKKKGLSSQAIMNINLTSMFLICQGVTSTREQAKKTFCQCTTEEVFDRYWVNTKRKGH